MVEQISSDIDLFEENEIVRTTWHCITSFLDDLEAFDPVLDNLGRRQGKLESRPHYCIYKRLVFLECSIYHIRLALLLNSRLDCWNRADVDNVIILWRHLISGTCEKIKV
ncbi:unnamed protein product [Onchocerca flexuosa]|uniref:Rab-GAP TBC domain-containing protein n=1 Tax=Onchocerca flexuosa TaxID=387005 RepID=A0A183I3K1_9BILA|nr:unnamed protein product [Onchocerca flexuosa]